MCHFVVFGLLTVAVLGFIKHRMYWHRHAWGGPMGGCHGRGYGGWDQEGPGFRRGRGGWRGFGVRAVLRRMFERLDTTPGQEKVIVKAVEDLRESMGHAKDELKGSRSDFAAAFRNGLVDEASMADMFVKHDTVISETRRKVVEAVGRIHEALDDSQRNELADIIEKGPGFGGHGPARNGYRWG